MAQGRLNVKPGTEHLTPQQIEQLEAAERLFANSDVEIDAATVEQQLADRAIQLIDVRETYEHESGHIPGARHIEIERLGWNAPTIDPALPVVFYCRLGIRAKLAAHAFRRVGIEARSMTGGFAQWAHDGRAIEPAGGTVADH